MHLTAFVAVNNIGCNFMIEFVQYIFWISGFLSKFCIFRFSWKNVNILLKNQMKIIFGFDPCIWKLSLFSLNVVSIAFLYLFNISSGFPDFHHIFTKYKRCNNVYHLVPEKYSSCETRGKTVNLVTVRELVEQILNS